METGTETETETENETEIETQTEKETETEKETDRDRDRDRATETETETGTQRHRHILVKAIIPRAVSGARLWRPRRQICDGLRESTRKLIFACMKRKLYTDETKVAQ